MQPDAVVLSSLIGVLYIVLLLYLDRYEREPLSRIGALFAISILATGIYGGILSRLSNPGDDLSLACLCIQTPLFEEGVKFAVFLLVYPLWRRWIDEPFDLVVYLGIIALGFSVQENIGYYIVNTRAAFVTGLRTGNYAWYDHALADIAFRRGIPGHLMIETIAAWVLSRGFRKRSFPVWLAAAYLTAVAAHAGWNFAASRGFTFFRFYVASLTFATILIILKMREESGYWRTQRYWRSAVERMIEAMQSALASAPEGISMEVRGLADATVRHLKWISKGVRGLAIRPGTDQASVFRALEENLSHPPPPLEPEEIEDLDRRLRRIAEVLGPYRSFALHWSYWVGLLAIFVSVGFFATLLSLTLEKGIVFF